MTTSSRARVACRALFDVRLASLMSRSHLLRGVKRQDSVVRVRHGKARQRRLGLAAIFSVHGKTGRCGDQQGEIVRRVYGLWQFLGDPGPASCPFRTRFSSFPGMMMTSGKIADHFVLVPDRASLRLVGKARGAWMRFRVGCAHFTTVLLAAKGHGA